MIAFALASERRTEARAKWKLLTERTIRISQRGGFEANLWSEFEGSCREVESMDE